MKIVVLKFGGTSVGSIDKIRNVSNIIQSYKKKGNKVIVVSSAMSGVTNDLIKKSRMISKSFSDAEYDVLVASGEQIACSLIAGRLIDKGYRSRSWLAWQIPIFTTGDHRNSRINQINKIEIIKYLKKGGIPIIAGEWWDPEGKFRPLHKFNPIRISYIKNNIINTFKLKKSEKPLSKIKILDIGCGGGLLSEPMSRLGADVVGIDASQKNINVAKIHAKKE